MKKEDMKFFTKLKTISLMLAGTAFVISCGDDDPDPCTVAGTECFCEEDPTNAACDLLCEVTGTACFCEENPLDEACLDACEVTASDIIYVEGSFTDGVQTMFEGALLNESTGRYVVSGNDATFIFHNTADGSGATWGALADSVAGLTSGTAWASIPDDDCGVGNVDFSLTNTDQKDVIDLTINTSTGEYTAEFDDRDDCLDLNYTANRMWLKGAIKFVWNGDTINNAWGQLGAPMYIDEERGFPWWSYTANTPGLESGPKNRTNVKPVWNPAGDWGASANPEWINVVDWVDENGNPLTIPGDSIAMDFGPRDEDANEDGRWPTQGVLAYKAFTKKADDSNECGRDCSNATFDAGTSTEGCNQYLTNELEVNYENGERQQYTLYVNSSTWEYEIIFHD